MGLRPTLGDESTPWNPKGSAVFRVEQDHKLRLEKGLQLTFVVSANSRDVRRGLAGRTARRCSIPPVLTITADQT